MSTASAGAARERRVRDHLTTHGWLQVMRAAASKGPGDLLMAHPEQGGALIQVGTKAKTLSPADRLRFITAADWCGLLPIVCTVIEQRGRPTTYRYWHATTGKPSTWTEWHP